MAAPSSRTVAVGGALLLLVFALSSTVLYLTSSSAPAASPSLLLNLKPFAARCSPAAAAPPLRVFMYDLPPRFHVSMMMDASASGFPTWPPSSGGIRRQHSVEYWMMASLQDGGGRLEGREAVRVGDPEAAEAFFVPFFSSLSFNVHGRNMTDPETEADRLLQVELMDILWKSKYWQRSAGHDHVIPMHHPNAFRFLRDMVNASILIVADFGRYTKELASLRKDVVAPYVHVVDSFLDDDPPDPFDARATLLFFRGRTVRKDEGKIRAKLAKILKGKDGVRFENSLATGEGIKTSTEGMRSSKFCLHPAGDTPSSCRLFDAIVSHCVPVIVSSRIELPFEDEIDYSEFSLFFSVEEALRPDYLLQQLRQIPKGKWVQMWSKLKNVSHHYEFQYPPRKGDAVNMIWRQDHIQTQLQDMKRTNSTSTLVGERMVGRKNPIRTIKKRVMTDEAGTSAPSKLEGIKTTRRLVRTQPFASPSPPRLLPFPLASSSLAADPNRRDARMEAAAPDGQEKVIATAQHKVKSLANSKNAADDMIRILSGFDNRLSLMSDLFPPPPNAAAAPESIPEDEALPGEEREEPDPDDAARDEERDAAVEEAVRVVERWESPAAGDRLVFDSSEDAEEYLDAASRLVGAPGARAEAALQVAMARLKEEFRHLLIRGTSPLAAEDVHVSFLRRLSLTVPSFSSSTSDLDCPSFANHAGEGDEPGGATGRTSVSGDEISPYLITQDTVSALKDIADVMLRAGYAPELCQVYGEVRRDTLMECLAVLGVDKMSLEEVQRVEWGVLDGKMKKWIQALKVVVRGLLAEERRVCSQILAADADAEEECFTEAAKGCILQLLNFGDAIAIGKRSSEKLFRILGMYEALAEVLPELEGLFLGEARDFIKEEAQGILVRLGDAVRGTVAAFANAIQGETSRRPLSGGEIHPLTRYVMNYVRLLADYSRSLNHLLDVWETELENGGDNANMTPLGHCVLILITHLQSKIEEKSKLYEDEALQNIFLMNNLLYIVQKVKDSELKTLLGDNWIRKRRGQIRRYSTGYLRSSWTRVLACLRDDGLPQTMGSSSALKAALKERFKNFNLAFEELYRTQTAWRVVDPQLREELKISISEKVLPAYRSFVGRFRGQLEGGRSSTKFIKYNPDDLENQVSDFFEGRRLNA